MQKAVLSVTLFLFGFCMFAQQPPSIPVYTYEQFMGLMSKDVYAFYGPLVSKPDSPLKKKTYEASEDYKKKTEAMEAVYNDAMKKGIVIWLKARRFNALGGSLDGAPAGPPFFLRTPESRPSPSASCLSPATMAA
jgi:hypothetical protein